MDPVLRSRCGTRKVKGRVHMLGPCPTSTQTWLQVQALPTDSVVLEPVSRGKSRGRAQGLPCFPFPHQSKDSRVTHSKRRRAVPLWKEGQAKQAWKVCPALGILASAWTLEAKTIPASFRCHQGRGKKV